MPVVWIDEWASIFHAREIVGVRASMKNSLVTVNRCSLPVTRLFFIDAREIVGVRASMKNSLVTGREQRLTNAMPRVSIDR